MNTHTAEYGDSVVQLATRIAYEGTRTGELLAVASHLSREHARQALDMATMALEIIAYPDTTARRIEWRTEAIGDIEAAAVAMLNFVSARKETILNYWVARGAAPADLLPV